MKIIFKAFESLQAVLVILIKYRLPVMLVILAAISIYKPIALMLHLGMMQTFANIVMNQVTYYIVGAAVFAHNFLGL